MLEVVVLLFEVPVLFDIPLFVNDFRFLLLVSHFRNVEYGAECVISEATEILCSSREVHNRLEWSPMQFPKFSNCESSICWSLLLPNRAPNIIEYVSMIYFSININ